ncbi:MAG: lamin tail domain-containing protein, partial [Melioribacteraceae bacterium]|nr:lamin tail domain-containing protein [Melioribacteraceae bacterium]
IEMSSNTNIFVFGGLNVSGTKDNPVVIHSANSNENWGSINFVNASKKSLLSHIKISGTTKGKDQLTQIGGISSYNSDLEINYLNMDSVQYPIYIEGGNFIMRNSKIHSKVTSDFVNVKYGTSLIEGSEFIGDYAIDTDAIDYDDTKIGIIRRNKIHNFLGDNSDAIDIGEGAQNVLIEDNFIYNCSDKGISIGQASSAIIKGNTIINCNLGVGIKDDLSFGKIDHNTFYQNNIAVSCYEKIIGRGGGIADISNTIFSNSISSDIYADELSEISVVYSLSDKELLNGVGNLFGNPDFINSTTMDFRVEQNSITIDSGDPSYQLDPDGSRTNIGASYYTFNKNNSLIISEINYNSSSDFNTKDWIEFYNPNDSDLDISNWIFKDSNDEHSYIFEYGAVVKGNDFLILCEDTSDFRKFHPNVPKIFGEFNFGLNNSGEKLRIFDNYGNIIDSLTYYDSSPWPISADGDGYTLQLINFESDNSKGANWKSETKYGTPGKNNIVTGIDNETIKLPKEYKLYQNYPNPFNNETIINFEIPKKSKVSLKIFDLLGREVSTLFEGIKEAGIYQISFNTSNLTNPLSSGIYFYRFISKDFVNTKKMILLK